MPFSTSQIGAYFFVLTFFCLFPALPSLFSHPSCAQPRHYAAAQSASSLVTAVRAIEDPEGDEAPVGSDGEINIFSLQR